MALISEDTQYLYISIMQEKNMNIKIFWHLLPKV